ncbi:hypothetical protein [Croceicoccus gelatinilyticus]|nr:hypothetical protein [Croceicoccus gelatinilyticus]MBS7670824.1 hypothetical protein [Croceicoccus gelatinilyticus]
MTAMKSATIIRFPLERVLARRREERMWTFLPLTAPALTAGIAALALAVN